MGSPEDRSARPIGGSTGGPSVGWPYHLARACREAAGAGTRDDALAAALDGLRGAVGAERAFLIESEPAPRWARAIASAGRPPAAFSRSVAARALAGDRPLFLPDLSGTPGSPDAASVRSLALRAAVSVPVGNRRGKRTAILLDSRSPLAVDAPDWELIGRAFAALIGLLRDVDAGGFASVLPATRLGLPSLGAGSSAAMTRLMDEVGRAARVPLAALVLGAPGTGKELVARALHALGPRRDRPFVAVNCAAIPDALLERELFGAVRGAFTGADRDHPGLFRQADGGTVLLDEIGDMPAALQAKLLRVVQEGTVRPVGGLDEHALDVRVVAATHRDLDRLVDQGRFRADFRDRLAVIVLRVPSLADRKEDLPELAFELLNRLSRRCGLPVPGLTPAALHRLSSHAWPGNVRELESILARALLRADGRAIDASDLDLGPATPAPPGDTSAPDQGLERAMIEGALYASRGIVTGAAIEIGWSRQKLHRRMTALGMNPPRNRGRRTGENGQASSLE